MFVARSASGCRWNETSAGDDQHQREDDSRMCVGSEFQVDGAETENAREVKLLVMPVGLARRFVLEEGPFSTYT